MFKNRVIVALVAAGLLIVAAFTIEVRNANSAALANQVNSSAQITGGPASPASAPCTSFTSTNPDDERALWYEVGAAGSAQTLSNLRHAAEQRLMQERQQFFELGVVNGAQLLTNQRHAQCGVQ